MIIIHITIIARAPGEAITLLLPLLVGCPLICTYQAYFLERPPIYWKHYDESLELYVLRSMIRRVTIPYHTRSAGNLRLQYTSCHRGQALTKLSLTPKMGVVVEPCLFSNPAVPSTGRK